MGRGGGGGTLVQEEAARSRDSEFAKRIISRNIRIATSATRIYLMYTSTSLHAQSCGCPQKFPVCEYVHALARGTSISQPLLHTAALRAHTMVAEGLIQSPTQHRHPTLT